MSCLTENSMKMKSLISPLMLSESLRVYKKYYRRFGIFFLLLGLPILSSAGFNNGGFESDLAGWTVSHWTNPSTIPTFPPTQ